MIFASRAESRHIGDTVGAAKFAARFEGAARWQSGELRNNAGDRCERAAPQRWRGFQQALRVGMYRFREHISSGAFFDDTSGVHDGHAIRYLRNHAEVV